MPLPPYIDATPRRPRTASATRRCSRASRARWPRPPPACISTTRCSRRCDARGVRARERHAARRRRHLPAGARRGPRASTGCTPSATTIPARRPCEAIERARARGGRVVAVGTTALRALESAAARGRRRCAGRGETDALHHARLSLPRRRRAAHQLPPAALDAADAGVARSPARDTMLAAYRHADRAALPLLQLRRRDAARRRASEAAMQFELLATDGRARRGAAAHSRTATVETPVVHAGRHLGTVKAMAPRRARGRSARRSSSATPTTCGCGPGSRSIAAHGGLHRFMGWDAADPHRLRRLPGVQPRRAAQDRRGRRGVRSPVDGDKLLLTPEESMRIQRVLGSDIAMIFDECTPYPATRRTQAARVDARCRCAGRARSQDAHDAGQPATRCSASSRAA